MPFLMVGPWIAKAREPHSRHCNRFLSLLRGIGALGINRLRTVLGHSIELFLPSLKVGLTSRGLRHILDARQEKPPLHVVEIDPVGNLLGGVFIVRILRFGGSRQERFSLL